jgi:hypothetical protein
LEQLRIMARQGIEAAATTPGGVLLGRGEPI